MTNEEIVLHLNNAIEHLKRTAVKYSVWVDNKIAGKYPNGSEWDSAFSELQAIRDGLTVGTKMYSAGTYGDGTYCLLFTY